jgi:hypothetical protein
MQLNFSFLVTLTACHPVRAICVLFGFLCFPLCYSPSNQRVWFVGTAGSNFSQLSSCFSGLAGWGRLQAFCWQVLVSGASKWLPITAQQPNARKKTFLVPVWYVDSKTPIWLACKPCGDAVTSTMAECCVQALPSRSPTF